MLTRYSLILPPLTVTFCSFTQAPQTSSTGTVASTPSSRQPPPTSAALQLTDDLGKGLAVVAELP